MERLPVALFSRRSVAELVKNRLVQAGFDACTSEGSWLQRLWFVRKGEAGVTVEVPGDQLERAEKLLLEWDAAERVLREAIRCPECKSLRVQYPQYARHSLLTNFRTQSSLNARQAMILLSLILLLTPWLGTGCVVTASIPPAPPPVVEAVGPAPFPGSVWVSGVWVWHPGHRRWEWHHGHWR